MAPGFLNRVHHHHHIKVSTHLNIVNQDSAAVCLQCFRLLEEIPGCLFTCACGFNLCSAECSRGSRHKAECKVYQRSGRLAGSLEREYPLIGPIRLLQAMKDPVQGERLTRMMDHVEEMREETGRWAITQEHVVQPLVKLGAAETEEQALRCVGLFRTNGVQLRGTGVAEGEDAIDDDELGKVRALFPTMASMSHSCLPNTRIFNSPGYKMVFRTKQSVSAGEELTVCYSQVIGPARDRAQDFRDNWFFSCQCPRCNDSSDLGWHSSSWSCKDCGEAAPPPIAPQAGGVQCSCGWKVGEEEVVKLEAGLAVEVQGGPDDGADGVREWAEDFLAKADVGKLHPHHALAMVVKLRLMRAKATGLGQMMRKVEVCREVLAMLEVLQSSFIIVIAIVTVITTFITIIIPMLKVLQPGLTETRGIALYEMSAPRGLILQVNFCLLLVNQP